MAHSASPLASRKRSAPSGKRGSRAAPHWPPPAGSSGTSLRSWLADAVTTCRSGSLGSAATVHRPCGHSPSVSPRPRCCHRRTNAGVQFGPARRTRQPDAQTIDVRASTLHLLGNASSTMYEQVRQTNHGKRARFRSACPLLPLAACTATGCTSTLIRHPDHRRPPLSPGGSPIDSASHRRNAKIEDEAAV